jgi:LppP/LprE lipoprotein
MVFSSSKGKDGLMVIGGALSEDGMCRPDPYQFFVFVRGNFAGTLSPALMRARSDGSITEISFAGRGKILTTFSRYTGTDSLCCPSRLSEATFEVRKESGHNPLWFWSVFELAPLEIFLVCGHFTASPLGPRKAQKRQWTRPAVTPTICVAAANPLYSSGRLWLRQPRSSDRGPDSTQLAV